MDSSTLTKSRCCPPPPPSLTQLRGESLLEPGPVRMAFKWLPGERKSTAGREQTFEGSCQHAERVCQCRCVTTRGLEGDRH